MRTTSAAQHPQPSKRPSLITIFGGGFLGLVILFALQVAFCPTASQQEVKRQEAERKQGAWKNQQAAEQNAEQAQAADAAEHEREIMVWTIAQEYVDSTLKSPASAKYPWTPDAVEKDGDCYIVTAWVDAQNSFGAMLRTHFRCTVCFAGETWQVTAFNSW